MDKKLIKEEDVENMIQDSIRNQNVEVFYQPIFSIKENKYTISEIFDEDMNKLEVARHPEQVLKLKFDVELPEYSMIRLIKKHD